MCVSIYIIFYTPDVLIFSIQKIASKKHYIKIHIYCIHKYINY